MLVTIRDGTWNVPNMQHMNGTSGKMELQAGKSDEYERKDNQRTLTIGEISRHRLILPSIDGRGHIQLIFPIIKNLCVSPCENNSVPMNEQISFW